LSGPEADPASLALDETERVMLAARARAFASALNEPAARARYDRLTDAVASGSIPPDLIGPLELMLDLLLQKAPTDSEPVLQSVFQRTPRGQALSSASRDVNAALRALRGQRLEHLRVSASPGRSSLVLETDRVRITLAVDNAGPRVESVESTA
jgi:hypothetical protein